MSDRIKSRDDMAKAYFRMYKAMKQNREKLASGEIDNDDLWDMAYAKADEAIEIRSRKLANDHDEKVTKVEEVQQFRAEREREYRDAYEWNTSNDKQSLSNIIDTEVLIFQVQRDLRNLSMTLVEREKMIERHSKLTSLHADLLIKAGIDRVARDKKRETNQPFDDWLTVKRLGEDKMRTLQSVFPKALSECRTESELRDSIKYHLGFPFDGIIDPLLIHHRRILGLDLKLDEIA